MTVSTNPFVRYRDRLDSYEAVRRGRMTDAEFVEIVERLDRAVAEVDGHGFETTPVIDGAALADAAGLHVDLVIKVEAGNVGGSHKARHLMGVALHLEVAAALGEPRPAQLAIASCGNAALGAGVIARALDVPLDVFVPTWADETVVRRLRDLGATVQRCERRPGEQGDPSYLRFAERVDAGAQPFSVQGTDTTTTFDGGRTLGWELLDQTDRLDAIYVQVGGGALATSIGLALDTTPLFPVQAEGCAPLRRAWDRLAPEFDFDDAAAHPADFMWPWAEPNSIATGILDDITYDWLPLLRLTHASGGEPIVAPETTVVRAHQLARTHTDVPVCTTGTAGLAGLMTSPPDTDARVAVIFSGVDRS